jgi:hypothetical protein
MKIPCSREPARRARQISQADDSAYVVAPAGAATALLLMFGLPLDTWIRFGAWLAIGLAIYASYGARHSRIAQQALVGPAPAR